MLDLKVVKEVQTNETPSEEMPSFNHSYICAEIIGQLYQDKSVLPLPELTLAIENGITPDISVFPRGQVQPDFLKDIRKFDKMPVLAIEVISPSQDIQDLLDKSQMFIQAGVKTVWTIEPFTTMIFVTTSEGIERRHGGTIESDGIKVDFDRIFG